VTAVGERKVQFLPLQGTKASVCCSKSQAACSALTPTETTSLCQDSGPVVRVDSPSVVSVRSPLRSLIAVSSGGGLRAVPALPVAVIPSGLPCHRGQRELRAGWRGCRARVGGGVPRPGAVLCLPAPAGQGPGSPPTSALCRCWCRVA